MSDVPAFRLRGLRKTFATGFIPRPVEVLHGLDLEVERGEIFGFLGPNGAGKTTTLKIAMGLLRPGDGEVLLLGEPSTDWRSRRRVGFLPEQPYFYDYLTAEELLTLTADLFGLAHAEGRRRVDEVVERVGLGDVRRQSIRKLSKGWLQRVGLAQALVNEPALVLLDEPMSGLDPIGRREFRDLIRDLREGGTTVVFSSHILSDAEALCDRIAILVEGRIRYTGTLGAFEGFAPPAVDLVLTGVPASRFAGDAAVERATETRGRLALRLSDPTAVERVLGQALEAGGHVLSVTPTHTSLEDVFEAVLSEGGGSVAGAVVAKTGETP